MLKVVWLIDERRRHQANLLVWEMYDIGPERIDLVIVREPCMNPRDCIAKSSRGLAEWSENSAQLSGRFAGGRHLDESDRCTEVFHDPVGMTRVRNERDVDIFVVDRGHSIGETDEDCLDAATCARKESSIDDDSYR
jgi:hypothetical protein